MAADRPELLLIGMAKPTIVGGIEPFATVHKLIEAKDCFVRARIEQEEPV